MTSTLVPTWVRVTVPVGVHSPASADPTLKPTATSAKMSSTDLRTFDMVDPPPANISVIRTVLLDHIDVIGSRTSTPRPRSRPAAPRARRRRRRSPRCAAPIHVRPGGCHTGSLSVQMFFLARVRLMATRGHAFSRPDLRTGIACLSRLPPVPPTGPPPISACLEGTRGLYPQRILTSEPPRTRNTMRCNRTVRGTRVLTWVAREPVTKMPTVSSLLPQSVPASSAFRARSEDIPAPVAPRD
jgi:hypothetical protein